MYWIVEEGTSEDVFNIEVMKLFISTIYFANSNKNTNASTLSPFSFAPLH